MFSGKSKIYLLLRNVEGSEFSNPKMETLKERGAVQNLMERRQGR